MTDKKKQVAERLKESRKNAHLTQSQVCEQLNMEIGTLSGYETGRRSPSYARLAALAQLYQVSTDYILGYCDYSLPVAAGRLQENDAAYRCNAADTERLLEKWHRLPPEHQKTVEDVIDALLSRP